MAINDGFVITEKQIKDFVSSCGIACAICRNTMPMMRGRAFQICDKCIKDLREIINERRKPKAVEIGFKIPGSASPAEGGA